MLLNEHVLLYRGESGKVVAMNDRCPHRGALLSQGRLEGDAVRCMYHGIKFDGTGKCVQIPGQDMIPPKMRVRTYPFMRRATLSGSGWVIRRRRTSRRSSTSPI